MHFAASQRGEQCFHPPRKVPRPKHPVDAVDLKRSVSCLRADLNAPSAASVISLPSMFGLSNGVERSVSRERVRTRQLCLRPSAAGLTPFLLIGITNVANTPSGFVRFCRAHFLVDLIEAQAPVSHVHINIVMALSPSKTDCWPLGAAVTHELARLLDVVCLGAIGSRGGRGFRGRGRRTHNNEEGHALSAWQTWVAPLALMVGRHPLERAQSPFAFARIRPKIFENARFGNRYVA